MQINKYDLIENAISAFNYHVVFPDHYPIESIEAYGFDAGYYGYPMNPPESIRSIPSLLSGWQRGWKEALLCDLEQEKAKRASNLVIGARS